ncbi:hypothetical protein DFP72DRAFT_1054440 [Ephemerocybe angulata]|uniref:Uncharacterized protein n=1 Tax=Ephemerocybe angulata TaxID=980116 RepID=A0A8H6H9L5_9AGAR|nr:hypothetical protein DFP72DRAFT_1054440 [Tulosesus angulatus]
MAYDVAGDGSLTHHIYPNPPIRHGNPGRTTSLPPHSSSSPSVHIKYTLDRKGGGRTISFSHFLFLSVFPRRGWSVQIARRVYPSNTDVSCLGTKIEVLGGELAALGALLNQEALLIAGLCSASLATMGQFRVAQGEHAYRPVNAVLHDRTILKDLKIIPR